MPWGYSNAIRESPTVIKNTPNHAKEDHGHHREHNARPTGRGRGRAPGPAGAAAGAAADGAASEGGLQGPEVDARDLHAALGAWIYLSLGSRARHSHRPGRDRRGGPGRTPAHGAALRPAGLPGTE